jgi:hypothetical protein
MGMLNGGITGGRKGNNNMKFRCLLTIMFVLFVVGILARLSYGEIDSDSILGIWLFDEGEGDVAEDSSENGFDGTIAGGAAFVDGKFGDAIELDGSNDYVDFGNDERLKPQEFTVVVWFSTEKLAAYGHIFQSGHDWDDMAGIVVRVNQTSQFSCGVTQGAGNTVSWVTGPAVEADTWYHGAVTFDGTSINLYLDGVKVATGGGTQVFYDDRSVRIGSHPDQLVSLFQGVIDEAAYFNEALEEKDILNIMNFGLEEAVSITAVSSAGKLATTWGDIK